MHTHTRTPCVQLCEATGLLFASCLDGHVRCYDKRLQLTSDMPWHNGCVREMAYNEP
jgi:hypothetical protein